MKVENLKNHRDDLLGSENKFEKTMIAQIIFRNM